MALTQEQFKRIMGLNSPEPITGAVATGLNYLKQPLDKYAINQNVPVVGGMSAADILGLTGAQGVIQDFSKGKNITGDMRLFDVIGLAPTVAPALNISSKAAKALGTEALRQIETGTGIIGKNVVDPRMNIVPVDVVKKFNMKTTLPKLDEFISAVKGTPNAEITPEGLKLNLVRFQKPEQELMESVRTGVFYLPEGSANVKHYKNKGTMASGNPYGGEQKISGETLYKNPLFVKGATGGKAPEEAYKTLFGKDALTELDKYVRHTAGAPRHLKEEAVYDFLQKYAPESADNAWNIVENSKHGNQLRYALQEAVIANQARKKGYDSIIGYSKGRGDKGNFISEVFDLREELYPSPTGKYGLMPEFQGLIGK